LRQAMKIVREALLLGAWRHRVGAHSGKLAHAFVPGP